MNLNPFAMLESSPPIGACETCGKWAADLLNRVCRDCWPFGQKAFDDVLNETLQKLGESSADAESLALNAIAAAEPLPKLYHCPFTIVADVNEGIPYRFTGMVTDKSDGELPIIVDVVRKPLYLTGRRTIELKGKTFTKGLADYTIDGMEEEIQIERKSKEDLFGTLGGRRDDFEAEIARIAQCKFAAVVIEAEWTEIFQDPPSYSRLPPKVVSRTISSWSLRYPQVHWFTLAGRQHAENFTFRLLEMYWRQRQHAAN